MQLFVQYSQLMDQSAASHFGAAVRARRAELGITMEQLATASGVSRGTLSRIENNELTTSLANAVSIADALGSDLSDLLAGPDALLVRAADAAAYTDPSGIRRTSLARPVPGVEVIRYMIPAGASSVEFAAHAPRSVETVHLISGCLTYRRDDQIYDLAQGDTLVIRADTAHSFTNPGTGTAVAHLISTTPR